MALIVEGGTGRSDAESYISTAAAGAYLKARGKDAVWADLDTPVKEQKLRIATDYMTEQYRSRWKGSRVLSTQALDWPRYKVDVDDFCLPSNSVPVAIANACAELALKAVSGELTTDVGRLKKSTKVGPLEVEYVAGSSAQTKYVAVDNLLAPFLRGGAGQIPVVRC